MFRFERFLCLILETCAVKAILLKFFNNLLKFLKNLSCSAHISKTYKNVKKYKKVLCNFFSKILA